MARLSLSFMTNLPDYTDEIMTPSIDYLALTLESGEEISLSPDSSSEFGVLDHVYSATFYGVDTGDGEDETLLRKISINNVKTAEVVLYTYDVDYSNPIKAEDLNFIIEFNNGAHQMVICKNTIVKEASDCQEFTQKKVDIPSWEAA